MNMKAGRRSFFGRSRRGSIYVFVLGASMLVVIVGLGALAVTRLNARVGAQANDAVEAAALAESAVEYALSRLAGNSSWRTYYVNGVETTPKPMGNGTISFKLVDEALGMAGGDGSLSNNGFDPARAYGYGRVRGTVRVYSVRLRGATPLDALRTTIAASDDYKQETGGTLNTTGGPVSTNGVLTRNGTINGKAEVWGHTGLGAVTGGITFTAAKAMPDPAIFDMYKRMATEIPYTSFSGDKLVGNVLSAAANPTGGATNPNGVYYIQAPSSKNFELQIWRIKGTLVIECLDKATVRQLTAVCWEPHAAGFPILIIKHTTAGTTSDQIMPPPDTINEVTIGANLNPPGTPYNGACNSTIGSTETYPSQLKGLIHVIAHLNNPNDSEIKLDKGVRITGTMIADLQVWTKDASLSWDSDLYFNPPVGYSTGPAMIPVANTWQWEVGP